MVFLLAGERVKKRDETECKESMCYPGPRERVAKKHFKENKHTLKQFIPVMVFITLSAEVARLFKCG